MSDVSWLRNIPVIGGFLAFFDGGSNYSTPGPRTFEGLGNANQPTTPVDSLPANQPTVRSGPTVADVVQTAADVASVFVPAVRGPRTAYRVGRVIGTGIYNRYGTAILDALEWLAKPRPRPGRVPRRPARRAKPATPKRRRPARPRRRPGVPIETPRITTPATKILEKILRERVFPRDFPSNFPPKPGKIGDRGSPAPPKFPAKVPKFPQNFPQIFEKNSKTFPKKSPAARPSPWIPGAPSINFPASTVGLPGLPSRSASSVKRLPRTLINFLPWPIPSITGWPVRDAFSSSFPASNPNLRGLTPFEGPGVASQPQQMGRIDLPPQSKSCNCPSPKKGRKKGICRSGYFRERPNGTFDFLTWSSTKCQPSSSKRQSPPARSTTTS